SGCVMHMVRKGHLHSDIIFLLVPSILLFIYVQGWVKQDLAMIIQQNISVLCRHLNSTSISIDGAMMIFVLKRVLFIHLMMRLFPVRSCLPQKVFGETASIIMQPAVF